MVDQELPPPEMLQEGESFSFRWKTVAIQVMVSEIQQWRDGPRAEVTVKDMHGGHLHMSMLNLLSTNSKTTLRKTLQAREPSVPWDDMIEQLTVMSVQAWRKGAPMELLEPQFHEQNRRYAIEGFIPANVPTLLYGDGATGKSYLAAAIGRALTTGTHFLGRSAQEHTVAYLDFEWDKEEHEERLMMLGGDAVFLYRRCSLPLSGEVRELGRVLDRQNVDFLIVDSLAYALGDDPSNAEAVMKFFAALRHLDRTALVIHHVPKDSKHPYGSVYIRNSVRSAWHVLRSSLNVVDGFKLALRHDKTNRGEYQAPIGAEFKFSPESVHITRTDADTVPELAEGKSVKARILDCLREGAARPPQIAEAVGAPVSQISPRLSDLRKAGAVVRLENGDWGLSA